MKNKLRLCLGIVVVLFLCLIFVSTFISYSQPMDDKSYDLSPIAYISEVEFKDMSSELGWTVFTQTGETVVPLTYDGTGCYQTLEYAGQTFYYSRVMTEELDAPSLKLGSANINFAVFLDGSLIYTDCPELDNRIGYLTLPMRQWDRTESAIISLPEDYVGKTLTIAQSTFEYEETPRMAGRVMPVDVTLYCDYAYESALIAESFQTSFTGAASYVLGVLLLIIFLRKLSLGQLDAGLLFLALAVFLSMTAYMYDTSYSFKYFGTSYRISSSMICQMAGISSLLVFLSTRVTRLRPFSWIITGAYISFCIAFCLFNTTPVLAVRTGGIILRQTQGPVSGLAILFMFIISFICVRRSAFHRALILLTLAEAVLWLGLKFSLPTRSEFIAAIRLALTAPPLHTITFRIASMMAIAAIAITIVQTIRGEISLFTEKRLAKEMGILAQQRYENLRSHNEEVMSLRHDMNRHFNLLRQMTTEERVGQYLDELIGQNEKIRPVVQSGNEMIDIILSSHINKAIDRGLRVEIVRAHAPEKLPLTDADLCSLTMNLLDNALVAAGGVQAAQRFIKLDLHVKNDFFVFVCENSAEGSTDGAQKEETVPKHGLGLKIVRQIAERYNSILQTEQGTYYYKVTLVIPLHQPSR